MPRAAQRLEDDDERIIYVNSHTLNEPSGFCDNHISTAKYNFITFLPKFLYEQFSRYANLFFLFVACIQQIPGVSPTNQYTTIIPLSVVLLVSAIKEVAEDYKRHKSDDEVNNRLVKVLSGSEFHHRKWIDVQVGDIVRVENGEFFPADLVLISSSEPDGLCYIETANLDGETNLKIRQAQPETALILTSHQAMEMDASIKSEGPNNSLYTYEGTLRLGARELPLGPNQLLLRGAMLRNTNWAFGIVVFTGHDSKLMRNATAAPIKRTAVDRMTNIQIIFLFAILATLALISAICGTVWVQSNGMWVWYIFPRGMALNNQALETVLSFLTFIILYQNFIPLSLIVTTEVVKYQQAYLIGSDEEMYHAETDTPAVARTSSLVEELGQVQYIFSDKTGTLTCNMMEFRQCTIGGRGFAYVIPDGKKASVPGGADGISTFDDMKALLRDPNAGPIINEFMVMLAVCHTVIPERDEQMNQIVYQASSPDEGALVKGASSLGYVFHTRKPRSAIFSANEVDYEYEVLNVCEFNSTRKRMSVIVRTPDGKIKLYCKGADTVILERLNKEANPFVQKTSEQLEEYAAEGLRTLCFAFREIPSEEYAQWQVIYDKAATTLQNRSQELDNAAEMIEKDMFLLGASAVEDKLQEGVPETIFTLAKAGIKVWVLTGDRQETAINIGYSCKLLQEDMNLIIINEPTHHATREFIIEKYRSIKSASGIEAESLGLVIDGKTLQYALEPDVETLFLDLAVCCKAVICCRVSPLQKALVVKMVKKHLNAITLAIGDGANDVSMIQAAHIGVGISGLEGLQAARSADFAISQFRFLKRLLLVHGSWSYVRLSRLILYCFYKNIALYMTQFWFALENGFSGQTLYESWTISLYNVVFTALPPFAMGIFDRHINAKYLEAYPQLYTLGQKSDLFNVKTFWTSTTNAILHSALLFYLPRLIYVGDFILPAGYDTGKWFDAGLAYSLVVTTVTLKGILLVDSWTSLTHIAFWGSFGFWFFFLGIWSYMWPAFYPSSVAQEMYGVAGTLYGTAMFWFALIIIPTILIFRDFVWKFMRRQYFYRDHHIIQEMQKLRVFDPAPRSEKFKNMVHKVRMANRIKKQRGFAFSQADTGQASLIRRYDTTKRKPTGN